MIKMATISSREMTAKVPTNLHSVNFFNGFNILFCSKIFDLVQERAILIIASILRNMKTPSKDMSVYNWSCIEARLKYNNKMLPHLELSGIKANYQRLRVLSRTHLQCKLLQKFDQITDEFIFIYHWCQWTNWSYSWEFLHQIDFRQFKLRLYSTIYCRTVNW